jgi:NAD(P)-dependent dehydrogenase (short-subunit alcohol dehydrogenase family)
MFVVRPRRGRTVWGSEQAIARESGVNMADRLQGKVAVITGCGSGLGEASSLMFAREGAAVVVADRDAEGAERVAAEIRAQDGRAVSSAVDVTSETDVVKMVEAAHEFGPVTVLYANAGIAGSGRAGDLTMAEWQHVIDINLTGVWLSSRAVLPDMIAAGGGSIINQASVGGLIGVGGIASYAAAKAGVIGLTRQMAVDYGPDNIRVNAVCPGTVPTPLVRQTYAEGGGFASMIQDRQGFDDIMDKAKARFPIGRVGAVEDIAAAALYLASDEASWTTGIAMPVDGGMSAW